MPHGAGTIATFECGLSHHLVGDEPGPVPGRDSYRQVGCNRKAAGMWQEAVNSSYLQLPSITDAHILRSTAKTNQEWPASHTVHVFTGSFRQISLSGLGRLIVHHYGNWETWNFSSTSSTYTYMIESHIGLRQTKSTSTLWCSKNLLAET